MWIARWDENSAVLTDWPLISNRNWLIGQRAKQYRGDDLETYGGVTLNIDDDRFDAPVASVAVWLHSPGGRVLHRPGRPTR